MYINIYNMARILRLNKIQTTFCINETFERRKVNTLKEITSQTDHHLIRRMFLKTK